ncbi:hypothetical protein HYN69_10960 [Gemmobacter aquarius]|uniref:Uncharacterized protein n=1 Tax=Paragemmobacter aquarius TaxID=2169400 RepID=A0A2S0UMA6_9RHOB|nr:hypothetical protein [Gemmobacter aquarius]AWB48948.1 hypothetical protein HYN69_10960 [Gemmobacter aquarius]
MLIEVGKRPGETRCRFSVFGSRGLETRDNMARGAGEDAPEALVGTTGRFFEVAAARMATAIDRLETGSAAEVRAAQKAIRELRLALWMLVDERTRVERLRNKIAGLVGDGDSGSGGERRLELDAARDEIGRRLAGLRAAGDG